MGMCQICRAEEGDPKYCHSCKEQAATLKIPVEMLKDLSEACEHFESDAIDPLLMQWRVSVLGIDQIDFGERRAREALARIRERYGLPALQCTSKGWRKRGRPRKQPVIARAIGGLKQLTIKNRAARGIGFKPWGAGGDSPISAA